MITPSSAIAPHAGLPYSGPTAARVFVRLALPRVIVIVAPNHTGVWRAPGGASPRWSVYQGSNRIGARSGRRARTS